MTTLGLANGPANGAPQTILVVDDTPTNLALVAEHLAHEGYRTVVAQDGAEGLQRARFVRPDLILLDVMMPGMDGRETCRRLKADAATQDIPVIFMTALDETPDKVAGLAIGAVDYLIKPLQLEELSARVRTHLRMYAMHKQLATQNERLTSEIAERQRAEEALRREQAALAAANAELEAFSYSVSHDLRAPLRAIGGFAQLLQERATDTLDANGRQYVQRIADAAARMTDLITDLLALSRVSRAKLRRTSIDMSALARAVLGALDKSHNGERVQAAIAPDMHACADAGLVRIVFENLIGNAIKFTRNTPHPQVSIGTAQSRGRSAFFVRDNGAGFAMEGAGSLFQPFQRLHSQDDYPGTGIGLAIVDRIVRRHGGAIWAEAAIDRGATFYFTLGDAPA